MGKLKTILTDGFTPLIEGKHNYDHPKLYLEALAVERLKVCLGCEHFKKEPIDFLKIKDERIPQFSEMMCGDCGCELPYKARQTKSPCKKWLH